jgi:hypothetical protein
MLQGGQDGNRRLHAGINIGMRQGISERTSEIPSEMPLRILRKPGFGSQKGAAPPT